MKKTVYFDLDGTLIDSRNGIVGAIRHAFDALGVDLDIESRMEGFIGPPLERSFQNCFGFSGDLLERVVLSYREYYGERGYLECELYPGVRELLFWLAEEGIPAAIVTSKRRDFAKRIVDHFEFSTLFTGIYGPQENPPLAKTELLRLALEEQGATAKASVMIGDTEYDRAAARANGVPFIGVKWGFGKWGNDVAHTVASVDELKNLLRESVPFR